MTKMPLIVALLSLSALAVADEPKAKTTHSFLATGGETFLLDGAGKLLWKYDQPSRDGWVMPKGNVLLAVGKTKKYPGGAVVEVTREGKVVFEFAGTQSEVNTVQPLEKG